MQLIPSAQVVNDPTVQVPDPGTGLGAGGAGGDGAGGPGGAGGAGGGTTPPVQSAFFGEGQHAKSGCADGQVEPSGQQELPAQPTPPASGQTAGSPTPQVASTLELKSRKEDEPEHHHFGLAWVGC